MSPRFVSFVPRQPLLMPLLAPAAGTVRIAAVMLLSASHRLQRLACRLADGSARSAVPAPSPVLEFHAEAGAPEGALYVDGVLVGHLRGVYRL